MNYVGGFSALLALFPNPIISANEAWFMSNTEKVHWLFKRMKDVIDRVNTYQELFLEIKDVLEKFDETVEEEVEKYIKSMYESGELTTLLERLTTEYVDRYLDSLNVTQDFFDVPHTTSLKVGRVMRDLHEFRYSKASDVVNGAVPKPYSIQGGCVYEIDGTKQLAGVYDFELLDEYLANNNNHPLPYCSNSKVLMGYYNVANVGTRHKSNGTFNVGHGNGMTYNYDDGYLYIAPSTKYITENSTPTEYDYNIYRVKPDFSGFETHTVLDFHTTDIAFYNGNLYVIDDTNHNAMKVYKLDYTTHELTYVSTIRPKNNMPFYNFDIQDNKVFFAVTDSKSIEVFDLLTGNHIWTYELPKVSVDHFPIKEIESISVFEDGTIYIITTAWDGLMQTGVKKTVVFQANYKTNEFTSRYEQLSSETGGSAVIVYTSYEGNSQSYINGDRVLLLEAQQSNPNGSWNSPFETIAEAVEYINYNSNVTHAKILLCSTSCRITSCFSSNKALELSGRIRNSNGGYDVYTRLIGGILCQSCPRLYLGFFDVYNGSREYHTSYAALRLVNCNSSMQGLTAHLASGTIFVGCEYCADIEHGINTVYALGSTSDNSNNVDIEPFAVTQAGVNLTGGRYTN